MADYLGLTIETVSRTLRALQEEGLIALPTVRHVVLRDRKALERMVD
jgi:CRP/FNR family nitrogen fixation transcriptional regulator